MDIIKRNFFRLLQSGALHEYITLEPMSGFKWKRLFKMLEKQKLTSLARCGIKNYQYDKTINIPPSLIKDLERFANNDKQSLITTTPTLSNILLKKRLEKLRYNERHAIDTSIETLHLLDIILFNLNHILNSGVSLRGILELGSYLRTKGAKVDFVKLEDWLHMLHIERIAQLQGSILIAIFNFEQDEIPFVKQIEPEASALALRSITHIEQDTSKEWHFRQSKVGFVHNNSAVLRKNLRRSIRYITYAPIETASSFLANFVRSLSEIEE